MHEAKHVSEQKHTTHTQQPSNNSPPRRPAPAHTHVWKVLASAHQCTMRRAALLSLLLAAGELKAATWACLAPSCVTCRQPAHAGISMAMCCACRVLLAVLATATADAQAIYPGIVASERTPGAPRFGWRVTASPGHLIIACLLGCMMRDLAMPARWLTPAHSRIQAAVPWERGAARTRHAHGTARQQQCVLCACMQQLLCEVCGTPGGLLHARTVTQ
jgi:hypothetical protein